MTQRIIPDVISNQKLQTLVPESSVREAAKVMESNRISAVLVVKNGELRGIVTERDLAFKVLAAGRNPDETNLSAVMTPDPDSLSPDESPDEALELMSNRGYRHLPILDGKQLVGMVSIRDLYAYVKNQLEEDVKQRDAFMFDTGYGGGGS